MLTRPVVERLLLAKSRGYVRMCERSLATDGTNLDLEGPLTEALWKLGLSVATPPAVSDADLAAVPEARLPYFLALAHVLHLHDLLGTIGSMVTQQEGENEVRFSDMARALREQIETSWLDITRRFLTGGGEFTVGKLAPDPQPPDAITRPWSGV